MTSHCASTTMPQQPVCTCPQHHASATPTATPSAAAAAPAGPVYHPRTSLPTTMPLIMDPSHFGSEAAFFHHQQQQLALYGAQMMALAQQQQAGVTGVTQSSSLARNTPMTNVAQSFGYNAATGMGGASRQLSSARSSVSAQRSDNTNNMMMPMTMPIHMPQQPYYHNQQLQQVQQQQSRQKSSSSPRHNNNNNAAAFMPPPLPLEEMMAIYETHRNDLTVFATTIEGKMVLQGLLMLNNNNNNNFTGEAEQQQQQQHQQIQQDVCTELMAALLPVLDDIALDDNGCHVVRCLVEKMTDYDTLKSLVEAMNETLYLNLCTLSQDTRRIPQVLFEAHNRSHSDLLEPIIAIMAGNIHYLAATQQGCIALMRVFEACFPDQKYRMMSPLVPTFAELSCDGFGNYVVQCAIEHSEPHVAAQYVTAAFTGKCMRLATNKFASNVLEKMVRKLSHLPSVRRLVMEEIMFDPAALQTAVEDCFANFVVQSIIETAINVAELRKMMERLKPALPSSLYATKIESKLRQKNYAMNNNTTTGMEINNNNNNMMTNNNNNNNNMGMNMRQQQQSNGMFMNNNNNNNRLRNNNNNNNNNNNIAGPVYAPNTMYTMQPFAAMAHPPHEMATTATSTEAESINMMTHNNINNNTNTTTHTVVSTATNTDDIIESNEANNNNNNNKNNNKENNNTDNNNKENTDMPPDSAILSIKKNVDNNNKNNSNNNTTTADNKSAGKGSNNKPEDTPMTFTPYNPSPFYGRNGSGNTNNNNNNNNTSSANNNTNNNGKNYNNNNNNNNNNRNSRHHHGRKAGGHHHNRRPLSEVH